MNVVQPTRIFCTSRISWSRISDWMPIVFHFGTENWEEQFKKNTLYICIFTYEWGSKTWDAIKTFFSGVKHLDRHLCTDVESFIPRLVCSTLKIFSRLVWSSPRGERSTGCPAWLLRDRWLPLQFIELVIVSRFWRILWTVNQFSL